MSTEQRDVRPFASVPALDDLLKATVLRYGVKDIQSADSVIVDEDVYVRAPVTMTLAKDVDSISAALSNSTAALAAMGLTIDDLSFVVVISSSYLKNVEFRSQVALRDLVDLGGVIQLSTEPRPAPFRSPRAGCSVEALVYLSNPQTKVPLRPWRFGTWLARAVFEVVTENHFTGFTPKPLTAEMKKDLELSPKAMRYVTLAGSPLDDDVSEESVEVWFDADLLAKASAISGGKGSTSMQRQLFVDAVSTVVHAAKADPNLALSAWADVKNTLLGRVVLIVAPTSGNEDVKRSACTNYLEMIKTDAARFMTFVEEAAGLAASYDSVLES